MKNGIVTMFCQSNRNWYLIPIAQLFYLQLWNSGYSRIKKNRFLGNSTLVSARSDLHSRGASWLPNGKCVVGALLPRTWHPSWWANAVRWHNWSWRRFVQHLFLGNQLRHRVFYIWKPDNTANTYISLSIILFQLPLVPIHGPPKK